MNAPGSPTAAFTPADPQFAARCRASFGRQKAMRLIGATLGAVGPGACEVVLPYREDLTQQKGFIHGGVVGMIADSACGYAAYSLMPATSSLVTVEYKINIVAAARRRGTLVASGLVLRPGRTLTVARAEVHEDGRLVAVMQQTLMQLPDTPDTEE